MGASLASVQSLPLAGLLPVHLRRRGHEKKKMAENWKGEEPKTSNRFRWKESAFDRKRKEELEQAVC